MNHYELGATSALEELGLKTAGLPSFMKQVGRSAKEIGETNPRIPMLDEAGFVDHIFKKRYLSPTSGLSSKERGMKALVGSDAMTNAVNANQDGQFAAYLRSRLGTGLTPAAREAFTDDYMNALQRGRDAVRPQRQALNLPNVELPLQDRLQMHKLTKG